LQSPPRAITHGHPEGVCAGAVPGIAGKSPGWSFPRMADEPAGETIDNEFATSRDAHD